MAAAIRRMMWPSWWMASMLMPARRDATFTEAHTRVGLRQHLGQRFDHHRVAGREMPLWTRAVKPPTKSTPHSAAAWSRVLATCSAAGVP